MLELDTLDFAKGGGTVTVVAQDAATGAVLMVAHADREALERTIATGEMHYRSRSRGLWHKGATSGNVQRVRSLVADCDGDAVLARVEPAGPACHTGATTCFEAAPAATAGGSGQAVVDGASVLRALDATIARRAEERGSPRWTSVGGRGAPPNTMMPPSPSIFPTRNPPPTPNRRDPAIRLASSTTETCE